jgi:uncharacterized delta-60 repeat protein
MKHIYCLLFFLIANQTLYCQQATALNFDGVNDVVDCGNPSALDITGTSLTLEAIITLDGDGTIISKEQASAAGYILRRDADGKLSFFIGSSGTWYGTSTSTTAISLGVEYHIAATYDGANLKLYIDGVEASSTPTTAAITSSASNLTIGDWPLGGRNVNTTIDDIRIWNVTRTAAEITANMATDLTLPQTGLVAYYKFNQGIVNADNSSETTLLDATSNTLNGTLTNFALTGSTSNWTGTVVISSPTTTYPTQIYTGDDKDLSTLQVTGSTIQWYAAATGGSALPNTTLLTDATTYYASQTVGGVESTTRLAITVNRISDNTQTYTAGNTVADLVSTPSTDATVQWFSSATGGTALASTDALSAGTYYVEEQTVAGVTTLGSGFGNPIGVVEQADGKILVADTNNNAIKRMTTSGTGIEILGSGFSFPRNITVQSDGKILVADTDNNAIKRMNSDGTAIETLGSGFSLPYGVAVQSDGKILVADSGNNAIKSMNADGTAIETLGSGFSAPLGVAVQSDGKILVADTYNSTIKRMDADGTNIEILGSGFNSPTDVAVQSDGKILVADAGNNVIKRMNADGTDIETLGSGFSFPRGVAVQSNGKILVTDTGNNTIKRITEAYISNRVAVVVEQQVTAPPTTNYTTQIYTGDDKDLSALQVTGSNIQWYAATTGGSALPNTTLLTDGTIYYASQTVGGVESTERLAITVNRISDNTQTYTAGNTVADLVSTPSTDATAQWFSIASGGTALATTDALNAGTYYVEEVTASTVETLGSGFNQPYGIAVQANGKILITEAFNNAIKRMNADGTAIETLGSGFNGPRGVAVQSDGKILVADTSNNAIKRMNADGTGIETLGTGFNQPYGLAVQADGKIVVADTFNYAIKRMNADGTGIEILGSGFNFPTCVAVQSDGKILVADTLNNAIKRMNADGTGIEILGSGFNAPFGVAVQSDGKILVADTNNDAIKRMNADGSNIEILSSGFNMTTDVAVQADGKILIVDVFNNAIKRIVTEAYTSNRVAVVLEQQVTAPPTTNYTTQIYTGDDKDVSTLEITGTTIQWYAVATGGSVLPNTTLLTDGTIYYASQTLGGVESTDRLAITVNRISDNTQTYTTGATVADLVSTPSTNATAQWFSTASGGTVLATTDVLSAGTYYVEEVTATTTTVETLGPGFDQLNGIAVQANGKILITVADIFTDAIKRMNADGTAIETLGNGFFIPSDVTIQPDGKILVVDSGNDAIKRMNTDGTAIETLGSGFNQPNGIAVQSDGKILVADRGNNAIKRMNADGTAIETLGSGFSQPNGIAVQSDGKILVADTVNNAIKRMNADGTGIETLGNGFFLPSGVAVQSDGKILVADTFNSVIKRMNTDGTNIETLGTGFAEPIDIAVQSDGKILVADSGNDDIIRITEAYTSNRVAVVVEQQVTAAPTTNYTIQIYTGDDKDLSALQVTGSTIQWYAAATGGSALPTTTLLTDDTTYYASQTISSLESTERLAVTVNRISDNIQTYTTGATVADLASTPSTNATAQWFSAASGGTVLATTDVLSAGTYYVEELTATTTTVETLNSSFNFPYSIAVQADGKVLVVDTFNNAIKRIDADGTNIETLGTGFNQPTSVAVQVDGKILVTDTNNGAIKRMDADGTNIEILTLSINSSSGIAVQADGKILVGDIQNGLIRRMNADGSNLETLASGFNFPIGIAVQSDGKILVADAGYNAIKRMDADGTNIETLGSGFSGPSGIAVQLDGKILVADTSNNVIKRMGADGANITTLSSVFNNPRGIAVQLDGKILVADTGNNAIKRITEAYTSNRVAVTLSETLSVEDVDFNTALQIYPNPVQDMLYISTKNGLLIEQITVIDALGRIILRTKSQDILDVSQISSGVLLLHIKTNKGIVTKRIIKH